MAFDGIKANIKDRYLEKISNELEIFFERIDERKIMSEMDVEVSDICNPCLMINFDMDLIVDMIKKQGIEKSILSIIHNYANMFKIDELADIDFKRKPNRREEYIEK